MLVIIELLYLFFIKRFKSAHTNIEAKKVKIIGINIWLISSPALIYLSHIEARLDKWQTELYGMGFS